MPKISSYGRFILLFICLAAGLITASNLPTNAKPPMPQKPLHIQVDANQNSENHDSLKTLNPGNVAEEVLHFSKTLLNQEYSNGNLPQSTTDLHLIWGHDKSGTFKQMYAAGSVRQLICEVKSGYYGHSQEQPAEESNVVDIVTQLENHYKQISSIQSSHGASIFSILVRATTSPGIAKVRVTIVTYRKVFFDIFFQMDKETMDDFYQTVYSAKDFMKVIGRVNDTAESDESFAPKDKSRSIKSHVFKFLGRNNNNNNNN